MILTKERVDGINLNELINRRLHSGSLSSLCLIVPTNRKLRNQKKELISAASGQTATEINIETLGTLSGKLLSEFSSYIPLSDAAASILLKQSISDSTLQYFSGYEDDIPAGTLQRIRHVISEYKRAGVKPDDLIEESKKLNGSEKNKAEDIAEIYKHFIKKCTDLGVKETGDIYDEINNISQEQFRNLFLKLYPAAELIIIDGFNEFTEPEIRFIERLSNTGKELYLNFDYYGNNALIFSHLNKCYNSLTSHGFTPVKDYSEEPQSLFRNIIRQNLFKDLNSRQEDFCNNLSVLHGLNREKEVEYVAKEIKTLITEKGIQPHRICVAFRLIDKYSPIIRDIFTNAGIPFNLTDRLSVAKSQPVVAMLNYLEILENDFYYKNLFRALSNKQLRIKDIDLAGLIKISVQHKIISGYNNWVSSIRNTITELQADSEKDEISREKELRLYKKALNDIEVVSEFLNPFTKKLTLREFFTNLRSLINGLGLPLKLIQIKGREEENIKSVTVFMETVSEVFKLLELEYGTEQKFPLDFFLDQIRTAVLSTRFNVKEKSNFGVLITTFNEIRGLNYDYLFLSGLCDGDFPTKYNPEIFFSGSYVRNELLHETEERYNFYQVLCSWEKGLYLSYPLQDKEKELTASNFLKDFLHLFNVKELSASLFEKRINSRNEILKTLSLAELFQFSSEQDLDSRDLTRGIEADQIRFADAFAESIFTGMIKASSGRDEDFRLSNQALEKLEQLGSREFSITQLEKFAACPYQYFLEKILFLNIIEEPSEEFEAFELGTLMHNILFEFYIEIRKRNIRLPDCSDNHFITAVDIIFSIAEKKIEETSIVSSLSFYDKESILGIDGEKKNSVLYKFLEAERNSSPDFIPILFEQSFNEEIHDCGNSIKVRGKIDRIELNRKENTFNTVDYKLGGKKPSSDDLMNGISLQLPLYMFAASKLLKASFDEEFEPADAIIYSMKYKKDRFGRQSILLKGKKSYTDLDQNEKEDLITRNKELIRICTEMIIQFTRAIKEGKFHLSKLSDRENKVCRFCNFSSICRIQEVIWSLALNILSFVVDKNCKI